MNKERNMYENMGYINMNNPPMPNNMPNPSNMPFYNNQFPEVEYGPTYNQNHIEQRIEKIEKQIKRLEQRISMLENPYQKNTYKEPDKNMYMI